MFNYIDLCCLILRNDMVVGYFCQDSRVLCIYMVCTVLIQTLSYVFNSGPSKVASVNHATLLNKAIIYIDCNERRASRLETKCKLLGAVNTIKYRLYIYIHNSRYVYCSI